VLSAESFQRENAHITLALITSAKHSKWQGDVEIHDLETAGLSAKSMVRQKLFTIDERLIDKAVGTLSAADKKAVLKALTAHFP
jgi:mRNA interferase MazF